MNCPECGTILVARNKELEETSETISLFTCPQKHGAWIKRKDIIKLEEEIEELDGGPGFFSGLVLGGLLF